MTPPPLSRDRLTPFLSTVLNEDADRLRPEIISGYFCCHRLDHFIRDVTGIDYTGTPEFLTAGLRIREPDSGIRS